MAAFSFRELLIKSFDRLRTNGNLLIPFVVSLSNHTQNRLNQSFLSIGICKIKHYHTKE